MVPSVSEGSQPNPPNGKSALRNAYAFRGNMNGFVCSGATIYRGHHHYYYLTFASELEPNIT